MPGGGCKALGFTLDPAGRGTAGGGRFVLTRPSLRCPARGPYYSLNDAREPDWPQGLRRWVHDARRGLTPSRTKFSSRYVCALVADVHRTLLRGGSAGLENQMAFCCLIRPQSTPGGVGGGL
jgi:fructose-1,6-bisphosphatase